MLAMSSPTLPLRLPPKCSTTLALCPAPRFDFFGYPRTATTSFSSCTAASDFPLPAIADTSPIPCFLSNFKADGRSYFWSSSFDLPSPSVHGGFAATSTGSFGLLVEAIFIHLSFAVPFGLSPVSPSTTVPTCAFFTVHSELIPLNLIRPHAHLPSLQSAASTDPVPFFRLNFVLCDFRYASFLSWHQGSAHVDGRQDGVMHWRSRARPS